MDLLVIGDIIGRGGYGSVYHALWNNRQVAIKKFAVSPDETRQVAAIKEEIELLDKLRDRHIIQFYGTTYHDDMLVIVMDLAEGGSLSAAIENGQLDWPNKTRIAQEIAHGLQYIHTVGVVHRDLKSGNVLLTKHLEVKLCDFGLAMAKIKSASKSSDTSLKGTFRWMAPELFAAEPKYSTKSDIYAFAVTLWEMAANCILPFRNQPDNFVVISLIKRGEREVLPEDTPVEYRRWVARCWDQDPEKRPEASEVVLLKFDPAVIPVSYGSGSSVSISDNFSDLALSSTTASEGSSDASQTHKSSDIHAKIQQRLSLSSRTQDKAGQQPNDFEFLLLKAHNGDVEAQMTLGAMYQKRRGGVVEHSFEEAFQWYRKAAEQGHREAQYKVAVEYCMDRAVFKDVPTAMYWYRLAAQQGHREAQYDLAKILRTGRGGVDPDDVEAAVWFRKAAEQGYVLAEIYQGLVLKEGRGVERDDKEAAMWFRKAAEKNNMIGLYQLATMYDSGRGVEQSDKEAFRLYSKSAEPGYDKAENSLGVWYRDGRYVKQSDSEAIYWFTRAAEQGNTEARANKKAMGAR